MICDHRKISGTAGVLEWEIIVKLVEADGLKKVNSGFA